MTVGRLFIIGIDGVYISIAREKDLLLSETVEWGLEEYPKLHTLRIWPSMFLGKLPNGDNDLPDPIAHSRSDREQERFDRANWTSPTFRILSKISNIFFPKSVRSPVGKYLLNRGVVKAHYNKDDWDNTVFDGLLSKAINLPTYNPLPVQHELKQGWKTRVRNGDAGLEDLETLAKKERTTVRNELEDAIAHGYDLTWAYVFCPDIFGHLDYEYSYPRVVEQVKNEVIDPVSEQLEPEDELVIVSDHGMELKDGVGEHRPPGWLTTNNSSGELPTTPTEVRSWIESVIGDSSHNKEEVLEDLGYI
jgi:hypothetical protein